MKALFLAGGMGTRLRPLTKLLPKPMLPIMEKPLLVQNMEQLINLGVHEFILSVHYQSKFFQRYFDVNKKAGVKTHILIEENPLGTAGAIKNANAFLDDVFLVLNADILADIDISEMYKHHIKKRALVTIAVKKMKNCSEYGVIYLNDDGYITAFIEKPGLESGSTQYINAGIYMIDPVVLQEIPDHRCISIERELFPLLVKKGLPLAAYDLSRYWIDVGTLDRYLQTHIDILDGKMKLATMSFNGNRQYISYKTIVHPKAKIVGPVYIGDNVVIEANTLIGPYVAIYSGSHIGSTAKIRQSVIWPNTNVEVGSTVISSIIYSESGDRQKCLSLTEGDK